MERISDIVLYRDNHLVVVNKPAGLALLDSANDQNKEGSVIFFLRQYLKGKIFPVNRLDRRASGICLFARKESVVANLNKLFQDRSVDKTYLAVSRNKAASSEGGWDHHLLKLDNLNKSVVNPKGKNATASYKIIDKTEHLYLYEINLFTGRHHQIRVQMSHEGLPIRGDTKYGDKRSNSDKSINLHSWKIRFVHPVSKEEVNFTAPPPQIPPWNYFKSLNHE